MNKSKNLLWGSLPVLIVAVIAILAFVRGKWERPLPYGGCGRYGSC